MPNVFYHRRRRKPRASVWRMSAPASSDDDTRYQTPPTCPAYEEIEDRNGFTPSVNSASCSQYELERAIPQDLSSSSDNGLQPTAPPAPICSKPVKPAKPASVPVTTIGPAKSPVYKDTSTTLVDNPLYEVAETGDDVTDLTVIDNDLYE